MASFEASGSDATDVPRTVLVVEDNELNMKLFSAMLSSQGYTVIEATDGNLGLALAQQRHPNLIIMDIQLPGMTGIEITQTLKADAATQTIPIIATTAYALKGDQERIMASGCDGYMAKPIAISEFLALVASFMTRPAASKSAPHPSVA
ncbi:MAG: response regulator [Alphaproteobacteria bacterium]|nr:response regulator [Alphaproteobacteria bacterium]